MCSAPKSALERSLATHSGAWPRRVGQILTMRESSKTGHRTCHSLGNAMRLNAKPPDPSLGRVQWTRHRRVCQRRLDESGHGRKVCKVRRRVEHDMASCPSLSCASHRKGALKSRHVECRTSRLRLGKRPPFNVLGISTKPLLRRNERPAFHCDSGTPARPPRRAMESMGRIVVGMAPGGSSRGLYRAGTTTNIDFTSSHICAAGRQTVWTGTAEGLTSFQGLHLKERNGV